MAEDKAMLVEFDGISFRENPLKYISARCAEATERLRELEDKNLEYLGFYEGRDKRLQERGSSGKYKRADLFVHELTPSIDTTMGNLVAKVEEREFPVTYKPRSSNPTPEEKDACAWIERKLNEQMRESGYLTDVFSEQAKASQIFATPSAVKVGWSHNMVSEPEVVDPGEGMGMMARLAVLMGRKDADIGGKRVRFKHVERGMPYVEWLPPDQFLYEPNISLFPRDASWAAHKMMLYKWEIFARAKDDDWDTEEITSFFDQMEQEGEEYGDKSFAEKAQDDRDLPVDNDEGRKFAVTENYVVEYDDTGRKFVTKVVVLENSKVLKKKRSPYRGFEFPFVIAHAHRKIGTIENQSTIERGMRLQQLYNELYNALLDYLTYRVFPPMKNQTGNEFTQPPVYGPGEIWWMSDPEMLQPVVSVSGAGPDLLVHIQNTSAKIRDILGSADFQEGISGAQYEKATKTKLRAVGAARRATPVHKNYGLVIKQVAEKYISLNQQYADDGWRWVADGIVDVPSLTNITDPEQEKQDSMLLYSSMSQDPMFQSPNGLRKRRNMWEDVMRKFKKTESDNFVITPEELEQDISIQTQMKQAMIAKQAIAENMAIDKGQEAGGNEIPVQ